MVQVCLAAVRSIGMECKHGLRDRALLPWRYKGPIREVTCGAAPKPRPPPGWPAIPRRRTFGGRLDHHGRARLEGKLGAVPRPILLPRLQKGIDGGLSGPPQETEFEVYNLQR